MNIGSIGGQRDPVRRARIDLRDQAVEGEAVFPLSAPDAPDLFASHLRHDGSWQPDQPEKCQPLLRWLDLAQVGNVLPYDLWPRVDLDLRVNLPVPCLSRNGALNRC